MLTVYNLVTAYCRENNIPEPTPTDLGHCGRLIGYHFRPHILSVQNTCGEVIKDAGFVVQKEGEKLVTVIFYPEFYRPKMLSTIEYYFSQIKAKKPRQGTVKKEPSPPSSDQKRKRIPVKGPVYSTSPKRTF